jgi:hypothetical protein
LLIECETHFSLSCYCALQIDENVKREIINHRSLRHPNIVRFKEVSMFLYFCYFSCWKEEDIYIYEKCCMKFHSGNFDPYSSGYCNGICIWRRNVWTNQQSRTFYWGWGSYTIFFTFPTPIIHWEECLPEIYVPFNLLTHWYVTGSFLLSTTHIWGQLLSFNGNWAPLPSSLYDINCV